jgi:hypothetical protein
MLLEMDTVQLYRVVAFMLMFVLQGAQAFDGGDAIALILGYTLFSLFKTNYVHIRLLNSLLFKNLN